MRIVEKIYKKKFKVKEKKVVKTTGKSCPDCVKAGRKGELIERKNRRDGSSFFGCSLYPKCKYTESPESSKDSKDSKDDLGLD